VFQISTEASEIAVTGTECNRIDVVCKRDSVEAHADIPVCFLAPVGKRPDILDTCLEPDIDERVEKALFFRGFSPDNVGNCPCQFAAIDCCFEQ